MCVRVNYYWGEYIITQGFFVGGVSRGLYKARSAIAAVSSATTVSRRLVEPHVRATSIGVRPAGMGK